MEFEISEGQDNRSPCEIARILYPHIRASSATAKLWNEQLQRRQYNQFWTDECWSQSEGEST